MGGGLRSVRRLAVVCTNKTLSLEYFPCMISKSFTGQDHGYFVFCVTSEPINITVTGYCSEAFNIIYNYLSSYHVLKNIVQNRYCSSQNNFEGQSSVGTKL